MEAMAEAMEAAEGEQDIDKKVEQALACPCLGDLKEGPCGPVFVHAFGCFIRSEHEDKGMDCLQEFGAFQACLQKHPEHVAKIMESDDGSGSGAAVAGDHGGQEAAAPASAPSDAAAAAAAAVAGSAGAQQQQAAAVHGH